MESKKMAAAEIQTVEDKIDISILDKRRIFICGAIDDETAREVIRRLWYLDAKASGKPITIVINSPGGSVTAGMAVWDQVQLLTAPITTLVTGIAASMGSVLSLCASKGRRFSTPRARVMIHQPLINGVIRGQATDLEIQAREMLKTREMLINLYCETTGKDEKTIAKAIDRDTWMSAKEALEYNLLDKIISNIQEVDAS
ncbi:ATP-dependent Clp protease proteolytic subunit [Simkania negevensis]|uniref:ATP-dependent Clp protease proteolytic subunit n=1 Tax=Simkania negevensis TaxID=83561 RepID=A0ABS3AUU3_9BACT|nr:ATP-dependent Clp protease proteolytic subunit [Simkania negevensis]